jgi:lipopolysaccharide biosynthesis glycosyltransferase
MITANLDILPKTNEEGFTKIILRGKITRLHPKFNICHSIHPNTKELKEADADPRIWHYIKTFNERPWHKNSTHPCTALFDKYLAMSPWNGLEKQEAPPKSLVIRAEMILYRILPRGLFFQLWDFIKARQERYRIAHGYVTAGRILAKLRKKQCLN